MSGPNPPAARRTFKCAVEVPIHLAFGEVEAAYEACKNAGDSVTRDLYAEMCAARERVGHPLWSFVDGQHMPRSRPAVVEMMTDNLTKRGWTVAASEALRLPGQEPSWGVKIVNRDSRFDPIEAGGLDEVTALAIAWHLATESRLVVLP